MKLARRVLSLFGLVLVLTSAHADLPKGLGLHLGLNFADVSMGGTVHTGTEFGYILGGTYDYAITPDVSLQPGVRLVQRGFNFVAGWTEHDLSVTYFEVPLLFQARFQGAPVLPFFTGGPVLGMKLGASCFAAGANCPAYSDGVKTLHMGLELGGGAIFPLENGAGLSVQARYHLGLTRVATTLPDPRHRGVMIEAGYLF